MRSIPLNALTPEQLEALEELAQESGRTPQEVFTELLDRYILKETGQNN